MKKTCIYVDGFNLYYRGVKNTPNKWLDLKNLSQNILNKDHQIVSIKYFTAIISGRDDPKAPVRQQTYIRALEKYIPEISVHYGQFMSHKVNARLSKIQPEQTEAEVVIDGQASTVPLSKPIAEKKYVEIIKTEEKGSDVNLAVHLVNDAWLDLYDYALVISNDSDLAESINLVKRYRKKVIGVAIPQGNKCYPSKELIDVASFKKLIRRGVLASSQLPSPIPNTNIHKPVNW